MSVLTVLLTGFLLLQCFLPLRTALKIGADEGFELAKATLCVNGYKLYTEIWNDQPPLHTFLITQLVKHVSSSVLVPRLLTIAFALVLLVAVFLASLRVHGLLVAALTTGWLIASPGFLELSCSVMQEIPALAPAVAALAVLLAGRPTRWHIAEIGAGVLFAAALQMKFIGAIYLPLIALVLWLRSRDAAFPIKALTSASLIFAAGLIVAFVAIDGFIDRGAYLIHFQQSWTAHFASAKSFEYGSPDEHPFDWSALLKNWDITVPAVLGIILAVRQACQRPASIIPVIWVALTLIVFGTHKPWWTYYYVHNAVPLCWCAGIGVAGAWQYAKLRHSRALLTLLVVFVAGTTTWMGARIYLQADGIRHTPRIYTALVLEEVARLKPFVQFLYTDEPVYSFHTGVPLPPRLGVISLKRFWTGDLTNERLVEELRAVKPGLLLLNNDARELPFGGMIQTEYRLVYQDDKCRLYASKTVLAKARQSRASP